MLSAVFARTQIYCRVVLVIETTVFHPDSSSKYLKCVSGIYTNISLCVYFRIYPLSFDHIVSVICFNTYQ